MGAQDRDDDEFALPVHRGAPGGKTACGRKAGGFTGVPRRQLTSGEGVTCGTCARKSRKAAGPGKATAEAARDVALAAGAGIAEGFKLFSSAVSAGISTGLAAVSSVRTGGPS